MLPQVVWEEGSIVVTHPPPSPPSFPQAHWTISGRSVAKANSSVMSPRPPCSLGWKKRRYVHAVSVPLRDSQQTVGDTTLHRDSSKYVRTTRRGTCWGEEGGGEGEPDGTRSKRHMINDRHAVNINQ